MRGAPEYIKKIVILSDLKEVIESNAIVVRGFKILLTSMDRSFRQKISKEALDLTCTLDHMNLKDRHGTFHPMATDYTFILSTHGTFSRLIISQSES